MCHQGKGGVSCAESRRRTKGALATEVKGGKHPSPLDEKGRRKSGGPLKVRGARNGKKKSACQTGRKGRKQQV